MRHFLGLFLILFSVSAFAVNPDQKTLPRGLAPSEIGVEIRTPQFNSLASFAGPPAGPVHSLGEWEDSEGVITLWPNAPYFAELIKDHEVEVLTTTPDQTWWTNWFSKKKIATGRIHYVNAETDSIWVRDYGPWWIVDGNGKFGGIDNIYNRPRPKDDVIPAVLAKEFNFPLYETNLVHTGGNYYSDGYGNAFSSTLVFTENSNLNQNEILSRMMTYLGITRYTTSVLGQGITIEHMDTFGKLVAPDTWVFSQFAKDSNFYKDSEAMVTVLQTIMSPYGTPYKILRMPMVPRPYPQQKEDYRAYINSFVSNKTLYFPTYGDKEDANAAAIYQQALPGYKIVGVDSDGTEWGDSVHCRSRNLIQRNTIFAFPRISKLPMAEGDALGFEAEIIPSPGSKITIAQVLVNVDGKSMNYDLSPANSNNMFTIDLPGLKGKKIELGLYVKDASGKSKWFPATWPDRGIQLVVP
jgi:agmatine deiminase